MGVDTAQPCLWGQTDRQTAQAGPGSLLRWHPAALASTLAPSLPAVRPGKYLNSRGLSFFTCVMGLIAAADPVEGHGSRQPGQVVGEAFLKRQHSSRE